MLDRVRNMQTGQYQKQNMDIVFLFFVLSQYKYSQPCRTFDIFFFGRLFLSFCLSIFVAGIVRNKTRENEKKKNKTKRNYIISCRIVAWLKFQAIQQLQHIRHPLHATYKLSISPVCLI